MRKNKLFLFAAVLWCVVIAQLASGTECIQAKEQEPCTITIENVTRGEEYPGTADVEEALNAITVPAINCKIKIENCNIRDHAARITSMAEGKGQIDLVNTGLTVSLSELAANGTVIPLDALLEEYGKDILTKEWKLLDAAKINGRIYAIAANLYASKAMGIGYNRDIAEKYGLEMREGMDMEDLAEIGRILKENDIYLTSQGNGELNGLPAYYDVEAFGGDFSYGVIFDPVSSTEIVNAYESEEYLQYCETLKSWRERGYIPADSIFGGESGEKLFYSGKSFYQWSSVSPSTERIIQAKSLDFDQVLLPFTKNVLSTDSILEGSWGITSFCKNPEKAMEFLNLLYTDRDVANLLQNGLEGREYEYVSENVIRSADGANGSEPEYGTSFSTFGDGCRIPYYEPATEEFHSELEAFDREARVSLTMGYLFDTDGLAPEIAAVSSVTAEYRPILETGMAEDVPAFLEEFNGALKDAGIDKIISENRRQLQQWMKRRGSIEKKRQEMKVGVK